MRDLYKQILVLQERASGFMGCGSRKVTYFALETFKFLHKEMWSTE